MIPPADLLKVCNNILLSSTTVKDNAPQVVEKKSHERKDSSRGGRGRGRGRPEVVQSHSIFEQGPCERVNKGRGVMINML